MPLKILPFENAIDVSVPSFRTAYDNTAITNAVLTFSIYDEDGVVITGGDGVSMTHKGSGHYRGQSATLDLTVDSRYKVVVTSDATYPAKWVEWMIARERQFVG